MRYFKSEKCTTCGDEKYSYLKPDELDELKKKLNTLSNTKVKYCSECGKKITDETIK
ncbi:hypothetical protein [Clostridioides difficile]|jgi:DNA-directed RNA polymerase subunit RPC12/RpoP|uniref:hypothetical protein n=1 Tax=Clostridioides difficile TaxID=1496 RepID=UPI00097FFE62|nr:hypothetical protein [Clostridioides difficile]SJP47523.1 Uncharacterised protein [Clostridioides difficile]